MDVSHEKVQADDHNTNQNEATLNCKPIQLPDECSQSLAVVGKLENIENGPIASEEPANKDIPNTGHEGMCDGVATGIINQQYASDSDECTLVRESQKEQADSFDNVERLSVSACENIRDESLTLPCDTGSCLNTPTNKKPDNNGSQNDHSAVDLSVASDDDIKVTCRCSSTPVNYSVHNTLNDTNCCMSSVGDASPISSFEADSKNRQSCNISTANDNINTAAKDGAMVCIQNHPYIKSNDNRPQPLDQDPMSRCPPYYMDRSQPPGFPQAYPNQPLRPYPSSPYEYPSYFEPPCGYNDYHPCGQQRSMTDVKNRHDIQTSLSPQPDLCCYPMPPPGGLSDRDYFVYPSIYVSNAGLISVLLRNDMSVEMTVDRTIRVVSHNHMMAVATDSKGTAASLYHPAVKIFQMGYNTDIATDVFRAKMSQGEAIFFSNGTNCFKLQESELQPMAPIKFSDIHRDQSVNLLFSSEGYGESLVATCMQVAAQAEYANLPKGGVIVRINGVKVTQSGCGDVTVVTGAKFIRLSPHNGTTRLGNRFIDIEVERDWSVKLTRGTHSFINTKKRTMVSNGKMEAGFDENNGLKVINLQSRHPLLVEPNANRRPGKRMVRTPPVNAPTCFTPRRRVMTPTNGRGGASTC